MSHFSREFELVTRPNDTSTDSTNETTVTSLAFDAPEAGDYIIHYGLFWSAENPSTGLTIRTKLDAVQIDRLSIIEARTTDIETVKNLHDIVTLTEGSHTLDITIASNLASSTVTAKNQLVRIEKYD